MTGTACSHVGSTKDVVALVITRIRRHVFHYAGSGDTLKYDQLKHDLAWYRVCFGQANQEDLLARLQARSERSPADTGRLEACTLNLAPFPPGFAWKVARKEAAAHLAGPDRGWLQHLLRDAERLLAAHRAVLGFTAHAAGLSCTPSWLMR